MKKSVFKFSLVFALLIMGIWALSTQAGVGPDTVERQQALRGALAPAGQPVNDAPRSVTQNDGPISPVTVNMADVISEPVDGTYEQWLAGDIDLDQEYLASQAEVAALQAAAMAMPPSSAVQQAEVGGGPTLLTSFDSLDVSECCGGGTSVPPDPHLAAGPNHLIAVANVVLEIYDKAGTTVLGPVSTDAFFSGNPSCTGTFDPTVVYDEEMDRWIVGIDADGTHFCAAASATPDPTGVWNIYAIPADIGGAFHDYPHIGIGDEVFMVGSNQFAGGGLSCDTFEGRLWAMDKADMYAGAAIAPVTMDTECNGTPQPLHLHGFAQGSWPALTSHYFVTDPYDGATLQVWEWPDPLGGGVASIVATIDLSSTGAVGFPVDALQMGGSDLQANDWRFRGFEYRNGMGWVADSVSCNPGGGTVDCVRWAEIDLALGGGTPSLVQAGAYASDREYRTFPDLAVDHCDNMAIGYSKTSDITLPGIWFSGREAGDPAGMLQAEAELKAGEIAYTSFDGPPHRWGDYTSMTVDPDGETFWYLGEYSKDVGGFAANWGTYIGSMTYDCDTTPTDVSFSGISGETSVAGTSPLAFAVLALVAVAVVGLAVVRRRFN